GPERGSVLRRRERYHEMTGHKDPGGPSRRRPGAYFEPRRSILSGTSCKRRADGQPEGRAARLSWFRRGARTLTDVPVPVRGLLAQAWPRRGPRSRAARARATLGDEGDVHRAPGNGAPGHRDEPARRHRRRAGVWASGVPGEER